MDIADQAEPLEYIARMSAIENLRNTAKYEKPSGLCLFCEEPIAMTQRFCDKYCSTDHELVLRMRKITNGSKL